MFNELILEITRDLEALEKRIRNRNQQAKAHFQYAVKCILTDLWKATKSIPLRECSINLRSGYYSETPRYRYPNLTYKQTKAVFDGLIALRMIEITKEGYYDRQSMEGGLTRFIARDELLDRLMNLEGHPAIVLKPDIDVETILLRDTFDGRKQLIDYKDTAKTDAYRDNLKVINSCFIRHWADLRIKDSEIPTLEERIRNHQNKEPIDLSLRTLVRIFSNGSFKEGGRFYRGWWQNVPSEYRKFITLDEHVTTEYDFSQLNPHMLYFAYNLDMGNEDAYDRVLDGQHRDIVKAAFNSMLQASTTLEAKPKDINIDALEMTWKDLRQAILDSHKPIKHLFFKGEGNKLQFKDSQIAENIMLQFAKINVPTLPVHDSFIMRQGLAGNLEEAMRRSFYDEFNADIPLKQEVVIEREALFNKDGTARTDAVTSDDRQHGQWYDRNTLWLYNKI